MPGKTKTVLVVDDEPDVVTYLETLLRDNGYATIAAGDRKEGMEQLRRERPDLVCLDITMPVESGIRFYRDLKEDPELCSTPVIVVTAVTGYGADPAPFRNFLGTRSQVPPPEGFFSKPIDRETFLAAVKGVLG